VVSGTILRRAGRLRSRHQVILTAGIVNGHFAAFGSDFRMLAPKTREPTWSTSAEPSASGGHGIGGGGGDRHPTGDATRNGRAAAARRHAMKTRHATQWQRDRRSSKKPPRAGLGSDARAGGAQRAVESEVNSCGRDDGGRHSKGERGAVVAGDGSG